MSMRGKSKKLTSVEVLVLVLVCLFLLAVIGLAAQSSRSDAFRIECGKNLSKIGRAMLIYANDYDGQLPRSSGRGASWAPRIPDWRAADRFAAYGLVPEGYGGLGTISSCFYLQVKYAGVSPGSFACPGDAGTTEFKLADVDPGDRELIDLWDFGPEPPRHCSYSYHMPFGLYALTTSSEPGMAVAADRNPWMDSRAAEAKDIIFFNPEGGREAVKTGNAFAHEQEGQNVLFLDGHVAFEKDAFCGIHDDNIYTFWDGGDIRRGGVPMLGLGPMERVDSLLVNDPGEYKATETKKPKDVNSADLRQTAVVATLDCPMPEHKNVVWCGTFQIAWDKFKDDIIEEPVQLIGAEELAERLNKGKFSPENIEAESFYATAGFVEDGIIEQIQEEMAERFPSEPKPVFDERYRTLPDVSVAYAYLSVDIGFRYPFYTNDDAFAFTDSGGTRTNVTSFCAHTRAWDPNFQDVREQVEILYYKYGESRYTAEFAVDLCKHTQPYQVVLARVPRRVPLGEAVGELEEKILKFKQDSDYQVLRKLRPIDRLIVPDVLYKLTHHFKELEWKWLANPRWTGYFIFEARQMIDFALSRTGVILKSEARVAVATGAFDSPRIEDPRYLYFDRPFLIYVKKRGPDYYPFFVMWVDNAELMQEF